MFYLEALLFIFYFPENEQIIQFFDSLLIVGTYFLVQIFNLIFMFCKKKKITLCRYVYPIHGMGICHGIVKLICTKSVWVLGRFIL